MRRIETYDWWPELVRRKDELSLRELAERFDVTPGAISAAFKRTGLSRQAAPPGPRIRRQGKADGEALPPEPGDAGATARPGSKDTEIVPYLELLGQVPDSEVAKKANVSVRTIASFRARHNVGGYKGPRKRGADRAPRKVAGSTRSLTWWGISGSGGRREGRGQPQCGPELAHAARCTRERADRDRRALTGACATGEIPIGAGAWKVLANGMVKVVVARRWRRPPPRQSAGRDDPRAGVDRRAPVDHRSAVSGQRSALSGGRDPIFERAGVRSCQDPVLPELMAVR